MSTNTFAAMTPATTAVVREVMTRHAAGTDFLPYPDPDARRLREALAEAEGVDAGKVLVGAGASELIWAALAGLRPRRVLMIGPMFTQYARACEALRIPWQVITTPEAEGPRPDATGWRRTGAEPVGPDRINSAGFTGAFAPDEALLEQVAAFCRKQEGADPPNADGMPPDPIVLQAGEALHRDGSVVVILCSPNNPGTAVMADPRPMLKAVGNATLLLDASYRDFLAREASTANGLSGPAAGLAAGFLSAFEAHQYDVLARLAEELPAAPHVLLLGSLTKFYACPGVRMGFAVAEPDLLAAMAAARPAWTVTALAEETGMALLARNAAYRAALPALRKQVTALAELLDRSGFFRRILPGVSFVTAALARPEQARALREHLLFRHRLLIRLCDGIPGMPPGFVRLQARPDLSRLEEGLADF